MNAVSILLTILFPGLIFCIQNTLEIELLNNLKDNCEDVIVNCVLKTIKNSFISAPTIYINSISKNIPSKDDCDNKFINQLILRGFPIIVSEDSINKSSLYMQEGCKVSVEYVTSCETLSSLQIETLEEHIKYLIIVLDYSNERCDRIFGNIGQNTAIYDVTYIVKMSNNDYSILTFLPEINVTSCTLKYNVPPTILSTCSSGKSLNAFPSKKIQNYMKCPFKVGMASLVPFSTITNNSELYTYRPLEENEIRGSDVETLKIIAEKFNFSLDFYYIFRAEENPYVYVDFLSFLLNGSLDVCAGGLYRAYGDVVEYSGVYGRQACIWMYPAKRDTRSWQGLVRKVNGLYIFMIFYFIYSIICKLFCVIDKKSVPMGRMLLRGWGTLIGTSSLDEAITLKQKVLNIVYLIMCFYLSAFVSIQMFSFLTILSPPTIYKTNTELMKSGLRPYLMMQMKYFMKDNTYEAFANTSGDCESFRDCEEKALKLNGVTAVVDGQFKALQAETAVDDEAITLRVNENLLTVYHEMLLRKDVPIIKGFQKMMLRLSDSGISDRLYEEAVGILIKSKSEIANKNMLSHSYSCQMGCSITLAQSAGAFYVWVFGCGLSFFIFVIEILVKRQV